MLNTCGPSSEHTPSAHQDSRGHGPAMTFRKIRSTIRRLGKRQDSFDDICSDVKVPIAHQAAAVGDIVTVTNVIKEDPTVLEQPDADGMTLLCHAVAGGQLDTVKLLQKMGGNINVQDAAGRTPLAIAAYMGWYEGIVLLLRKGAKQDIYDKSGRLPIHAATYQSETRSMAILMQNLSEEDVNQPDNEGMTTLHWAAFHNRPDVVQLLLMRGADITSIDIDGKTALHWAAQNGSTACCNVILGATGGAHLVNTIDNTGKTCVHLAAAAGHCSTLKELATLKYTNLEALDPDDRTPLHWAAASGQAKCVALLLKLNVCPTPIDADGGTPLDYAIQGCHQECLDLLEAADRVSEVEVDVESAAKTIEMQHTISPVRKKRFGFLTNFFSRRSPKCKRGPGTAEDETSCENLAAGSDSFYRLQFAPEMSSGGDSFLSEEGRSDATADKDDLSGGEPNSSSSQAAAMEETTDRQGLDMEELAAQIRSDLVISDDRKTNAKRNSLNRRSIDAACIPLMRTDIDANIPFSMPQEEDSRALKIAGDFMGVPPGVAVGDGSSRLAKLSTKLAPIQTNSFLTTVEDNSPAEDVEIPLQKYSRLPSPPAMKREDDNQSGASAGSADALDSGTFPALPLRNAPSPYGRLDPIPAHRVESFTSSRMDRPKHEILTRKRSRSHSNVLEQRGANSLTAEYDPLLASIGRASRLSTVSGPPSPVNTVPAPLAPLKGHRPKRSAVGSALPPPAKSQQPVPRSEMRKLTQSWEHLLNPAQVVNKPRSQSLKTQGEIERHVGLPRSISHEPGIDWAETALSSGRTKKGRKKSKKPQKRPGDSRKIQEHDEESSARGHSIFPPILPGPPVLFSVQNRVSPRRSRVPSTGDVEEVTSQQACTMDSEGRDKKKKKKKKDASEVHVEVCSHKGHWNDEDEDDAGASGSSGGSGRAERRAAQAVGTVCERGPQFSGGTPSGQMGTSSNTVAMHGGTNVGSDDIQMAESPTTQSLIRHECEAQRTYKDQSCLVRAHPKLVRTRSPCSK
ncbi:uncharacterized protein LOC118414525 isoform X1 [Branchiostoma floridae]|uniref:Uncharacterized protein LOC118414525 isoform X1 n=1 Tax=Branchiostoma floridae TaxID=7739 RepID=A0A9J7L1L0_BRAFL|nr:uncharacterized protein LOC118414525 isoform X1 [Branchiostoma floridae]